MKPPRCPGRRKKPCHGFYIYIIDYIIDVVYFRTTFSNALWTEIFETSDVRNMI